MILSRLRDGTREQHQRLEQVVDLPARLSSLKAYKSLLELFYGLYQPLESHLSSHRRLSLSGLAAERLGKHTLLEQDLLALGESPEAIKAIRKCSRLPDLPDVFSAAGCLYVLEGATLGGQIVSREVDQRLNISQKSGRLFFASYGSRVREMWTAYCLQLTALAAENSRGSDAIVKGASETFTCFEEWMR